MNQSLKAWLRVAGRSVLIALAATSCGCASRYYRVEKSYYHSLTNDNATAVWIGTVLKSHIEGDIEVVEKYNTTIEGLKIMLAEAARSRDYWRTFSTNSAEYKEWARKFKEAIEQWKIPNELNK